MSTTYALALPEPRARRQTQLYGTRAQLAVGDGDVEGYLALAGCDKRAGTASYALRIVNQSQHLLRARMTCARLKGEAILAYPLDVHIAPFSVSETLLPVRMSDVGPYDRAIVQVAGGDVAFSLEAPAPPRLRKHPRWIAVTAACMALTLGTAFAAAAATPRLSLLAAPKRVFGGAAVDVPYSFGGWASMQYALQTRDGQQLSAGLLKAHQGTLHLTVPATAGPNVVLSVAVAGPFGEQNRSKAIAIVAGTPPKPKLVAPQAAQIHEFNVATPVVRAGGHLTLSYVTNARSGEIWLLDESGRLWAKAPVEPYGQTTIAVPQGTAGHQMRAVLHARNGATDSIASVGFVVVPGALVPASDSSAAPKVAPAQMALSTDQAAPGDVVTVMLDGAHGDARITMTDDSGASIEQGDIPSGQNAVTITAPEVTKTTTFYVMAGITQGVGDQTLVKKLIVAPRSAETLK